MRTASTSAMSARKAGEAAMAAANATASVQAGEGLRAGCTGLTWACMGVEVAASAQAAALSRLSIVVSREVVGEGAWGKGTGDKGAGEGCNQVTRLGEGEQAGEVGAAL